MEQAARKNRYDKIDGLRTIGSVGILLMHVLANAGYGLDGFVFDKLIPSFTNFVFLFMIVSGFSMCCGYYEKIRSGEICLEAFYAKRFGKALPFFAVLCLLDFAVSPSAGALCELLANLTLCFGLIPNHNIQVIGVGWFLGLVFVFYFLFPFFCTLLASKKRAWLSFAISLLMHHLCVVYFEAGRSSIAYSGVYFMAGGMVYLYREKLRELASRHGVWVLLGIAVLEVLYFIVGDTAEIMLLLYTSMLVYALGARRRGMDLLSNPVTKVLSEISMEIYLSHMVIFRVIDKLGLLRLVSSDLLAYGIAVILTFAGTIMFALVMQKLLKWLNKMIKEIYNIRSDL